MSDIDTCFEKIRLSMEEMQDHFKKQECKVVEMSQKIIDMERRMDQLSAVKNPIKTGEDYLDFPAPTPVPIETGEDYLDFPAKTLKPIKSEDYLDFPAPSPVPIDTGEDYLDLPATTPDAYKLYKLQNEYDEIKKEYDNRFGTGSPPRGSRLRNQQHDLVVSMQGLLMEIDELRK